MRFTFLDGKAVEYVQIRLTPDRTVDNKKVHDLFRTLSSFYVSPLERLQGKKTAGALWWDVMIRPDDIAFYCTVPAEWKKEIRLHMANVWPHASIEEVEVLQTVIPASAAVCEMKYRRSNMFAMQVDRRIELEPMQSILSIADEMSPGDLARLSICAEPVSRLDWQEWVERQHKEFQLGRTPRRTRLTKRDILVTVGEVLTGILQAALDVLHAAISGEEEKKPANGPEADREKRLLMIDGSLAKGTVNKRKAPTFNTYIRIASSSPDAMRQQIILRTVSNSFNDLTADNELERTDIHGRLQPVVIRELNTYRISWPTRLDLDKNVMSNEELGRLVELPTAALQDIHRDRMDTLESRQIEVPAVLTKGGILIGDVSYKKSTLPVFMPVKDWDQLCLPTVAVGGMGTGKTKGFASNRGIHYVQAGFSALLIDPKKSEMWEQIEHGLPPQKRRRILLGDQVISLDFREALHAPQAKARLAQIMLAFFEDNTDTAGAQTQRFLRAAVMGMQTGKLSEIIRIFTDAKYREQVISMMPANLNRETLQQFHRENEGRQRQIVSPIFNRLDTILGDPYLEACMNTDGGIDMVDILSKREVCTVIDVPDRLNTRDAKDLLINLISFKIDAAMSLRRETFPFAVVYDEPHQYIRSARLWKNAAVESRAYRLAYHWLFHSWEQIPRDLAEIIKAAGPHYYIYQSSKATYKGLLEEIAPFSLDDGLNTKRHHAIMALKVGDKRMTPLMVHMAPPVLK